MRRPRLKAPADFLSAIYHCVSRVVDRQFVLQDVEKEQFVRFMRMYEALFGLSVITYCVMGNHFHVLVEVPKRPAVLPTNSELVALIRKAKGNMEAESLERWFEMWREQGNFAAIEAARESYFSQMWDVSQFMKVLKQRFTQWFNGSRPVRRKGTLWEDRFRSVLVESGEALRAMAAYIDLNPIRANLVSDPKDYRWSGYGEACAGRRLARKGLQRVLAGLGKEDAKDATTVGGMLAWYRMQVVGRGQERRDASGKVTKVGLTQTDLAATERRQGQMPFQDYLRLRVRYFTDGSVLGTKAFVNGIFKSKREWFSEKRKDGARTLKGLGRASPLRTMRALVKIR